MEIVVNGETHRIEPMSVAAFLETVGIDAQRVAVELNLEILPKADYGSVLLKDGDRLEVVHFVGGGRAAQPGGTSRTPRADLTTN